MGIKSEIEYLLQYYPWTRRMVIGVDRYPSKLEMAFQEFPHYINELIYTNLHLSEVIRLHENHTYFRMQYDTLQSEYLSNAESFSLRDDWRIECSFMYVVQYLYDLLEATGKNLNLTEMLKRRYQRVLIEVDSGSFESEKRKEIYHQSMTEKK